MPGIAANQDTYRTSSNIADFATLNNVVKGFHDFLGRHITIHPVNLKDVDIRSKTFHAAIHSVKDMLPRQADLVHAGAIIARQLRRVDGSPVLVDKLEAFGHDDHLRARNVVLFDGGADNLLGPAVRVRVCHVPCVDATVKGILEDGEGFFLVEEPRLPVLVAKTHTSEDDLRDFEAGLANSMRLVRFRV